MLRRVAQTYSKASPMMMQMYANQAYQARLLLPLPQMMIHSRGYTNHDDHHSFWYNEINFALQAAKNTDNMVYVF